MMVNAKAKVCNSIVFMSNGVIGFDRDKMNAHTNAKTSRFLLQVYWHALKYYEEDLKLM